MLYAADNSLAAAQLYDVLITQRQCQAETNLKKISICRYWKENTLVFP